MIYLDNAATTRMKKEVLDEMIPYFIDKFENPSSIYSPSREINKHVEEAKKVIAESINADSKEIYFTSGGSESDNWAIKGIALLRKDKGKPTIWRNKFFGFARKRTLKNL